MPGTPTHPEFKLLDVVIDGQFGPDDAVKVRGDAHYFTMRNVEVRNSGQDCVDIGSHREVLIENSNIHHCLRSERPNCDDKSCRIDAHGVAAGSVRGLTIRDTVIHSFSGDGIQIDADRLYPGWDRVQVERVRIRLEPLVYDSVLPGTPLPFMENVVPGEDGVDTKTPHDGRQPSRISFVDCVFSGFRSSFISNSSAFNLKENVQASIDRVLVYDSNIAFRVRGRNKKSPQSAKVVVSNSLIYKVDKAIRYEDDIANLTILSSTFGDDIRVIAQAANAAKHGVLNAKNVLILGKPSGMGRFAKVSGGQLSGVLSVDVSAFVDASEHDYRLVTGSPAIDAGERLDDVAEDFDGNQRPRGPSWDFGAYEYQH